MEIESANTADIILAGQPGLNRAVAALKSGKLVSFATETVYGLGADATNDQAVAAIFAAKGRPQFNPLIVHLPDLEAVAKIVELGGVALKLAQAFWPGPFTLVLKRRADSGVSLLVSAGLDTIAVRVPKHPLAQALLQRLGRPVAAPSANISGRISPTRAEHVAAELAGRIEFILDGGPASAGLESTIVRVTATAVELLRPGSVTPAEIEAVAGLPVIKPEPGKNPTSPGQMASHYAPSAQLRLNAKTPGAGEAYLAYGKAPPCAGPLLNLSPQGNITEAAANLFAYLRELDSCGTAVIAVAPIPITGLGLAINDRLQRAAAPRPQETQGIKAIQEIKHARA